MKRILILSIAVTAAMGVANAGHGSRDWVHTGTILVNTPTAKWYANVTELVSPCGGSIDPDVPAGVAQGTDGEWFELPADAGSHSATLTATSLLEADPAGAAPGTDVDAWFYDDGCTLIRPSIDPNAYHMATSGSNEFGVVPEGARYVVVDLVLGVNATYIFTVQGMPAPDAG